VEILGWRPRFCCNGTVSDTILAEADALRDFSARVAAAMGAPPDAAAEVARHLVGANLAGHDSHGVLRWPQYVDDLDRGDLDPAARVEVLRDGTVTALFDAHRCFGQHSTMVATEWAVERADRHGVAAAAIRHSTHIGRLGEYTERMTRDGMIGIVTVGLAGGGAVSPFGGAARFLSTNPWSVGVPAGDRPPFIFDAATSTQAEGKVRLARARGVQVPAGVIRDPEGRPTTDPEQLYAGGSLTVMGGDVAGHKGHGLSLASALIGGLAMIDDSDPSGAGAARRTAEWGTRLAGVFVVAIGPAAFGDPDAYQRQVASVLDALREVAPAPGVGRVLVSGDPERENRRRRAAEGIELPERVWADLDAIGERFGVPLPG
jgi:hydroxycarboxylate dehydrogenase B